MAKTLYFCNLVPHVNFRSDETRFYVVVFITLLTEKKINMPEEVGKKEEKKLKPCCACPETKKVRDEW